MDFIAKRKTITPATSKEAAANKLKSELERPYHINIARPKNAIEINISRRWALRMIRIRIELDCIPIHLSDELPDDLIDFISRLTYFIVLNLLRQIMRLRLQKQRHG